MKPKFTMARSRAELIADYQYGTAYADVSKEEREKAKTMDDESYPIDKCKGEGPSVESAIHAVGRGSGDHDAIRRHIMQCAGELGCSDLIPDNWAKDGSVKAEGENAADGDALQSEGEMTTMECAACGEKTPADGKFCAYCGSKLAASNEGELAAQEECPKCKGTGTLEDKQCPECEGTGKVPAKILPDDKDSAGEMTAAGPGSPAPGAPESPPAEEGGETSDLNEPPAIPDNDAIMGPAFTIPVAIIEGQSTGDGRSIAVGALDWRTPPLPLMLLATATHDPMGMDMNAPAVLAGRIDSLERAPGESGTEIISCKGFCLNDENGMYLADLCEQMGRLGVSADVAVEESSIEVTDVDEIGFPIEMNDELTKGTIMAITACPMPAFEGAYMVLGDGSEQPEAIPQQADQEPVTAASPHYMTYAECEPCEEGLEVIIAASGPARPPKAWFEDPHFTPGDGRLARILGSDGEEKYACPMMVMEDGRVFGHIAPWDVCHTGRPGCVTAPPSACDYAHFKRGQYVTTAEGEKIRVGVLTADTKHAALNLGPAAAMAHYEDTGLVAADVNVGEDEYGIWLAGALRPGVTETQVRNITAASPSGDWRMVGGQLELVAALAVPLPGFPLVVVDHAYGERQAIVAAGAKIMYSLKHPVAHEYVMRDSMVRALERLAARDARERIALLR